MNIIRIFYQNYCALLIVIFIFLKQDERTIYLYAYFFAPFSSVNLIYGILEHGPTVIEFYVPIDFEKVGCVRE